MMSALCVFLVAVQYGGKIGDFSRLRPILEGNFSKGETSPTAPLYQESVPVLLTICFVAALINIEVFVSVYWLRLRTRTPTLSFTVSLTAADAWVALLMALGFFVNNIIPASSGGIPGGPCVVLVIEGIRVGAMITSVLHLMILAINHYCGVLRPLAYNVSMTPVITNSLIGTLWIGPPLALLVFFGLIPGQAFRSPGCWNVKFYFFSLFRQTLSVFIFVPLLLMLVIYGHIFIHIRLQRGAKAPLLPRHSRVPTGSSKAIVTTGLILGTFVCGWLPAFVRFALVCCDCPVPPMDNESGTILGIVVNLLILLKCLIDPIIYATRMKEIRTGLELMHVFCCGRKTYKGMTRRQTVQQRLNSLRTRSFGNPSIVFGSIHRAGATSSRTSRSPTHSPQKRSSADVNCTASVIYTEPAEQEFSLLQPVTERHRRHSLIDPPRGCTKARTNGWHTTGGHAFPPKLSKSLFASTVTDTTLSSDVLISNDSVRRMAIKDGYVLQYMKEADL